MGPFEAFAYRDRNTVEKRFGDARSLLDFCTPCVSVEGTLAGKLFVTFVALVLASWLRRRMRKGHRPRVPGVTGRQRDIFDSLGHGLPTMSWLSGNLGW